jgi:hypothetical protein
MPIMKAITIIIFLLLGSFGLMAQTNPLAGTVWKVVASQHIPDVAIRVEYQANTFSIIAIENNTLLGVYNYVVEGTNITYTKANGSDPCQLQATGRMSFEMREGKLYLRYISDECGIRAKAWTSINNELALNIE